MLIILDSSLVDKIANNSDIQSVVEKIAQSRHLGRHIVYADRKTLEFLSQYDDLSKVARGVYTNLYNGLPQLKAYLKCIDIHVKIVWDEETFQREQQDNKHIILVSYTNLKDSLFEETLIIAENLRDINVYAKVTEIYQYNKQLNKICLQYSGQGCGGQEIITAFQKHLSDTKHKFCLCISDSDKKSPYHNYGSIAKKLSEIIESAELLCHFCNWITFNARAIENLFPISFYQDSFSNDVNKRDAIEFLQIINNSKFAEARKYLDMKDGLKLFEVLDSANKGKEDSHQYWLLVIKEIDFLNKFLDCREVNQCPESSKKDCKCKIWTGFGNKTMNDIIEKCLKTKSNAEISEKINEDLILKDEWERIGKTILDWCCGLPPRSTS